MVLGSYNERELPTRGWRGPHQGSRTPAILDQRAVGPRTRWAVYSGLFGARTRPRPTWSSCASSASPRTTYER